MDHRTAHSPPKNGTSIDEAAPASPRSDASDLLLTRSEAADRLGCSKTTIRRLEGNALRPIVGPDGVRRFSAAQVHTLGAERARDRGDAPDMFNGSQAAEVFRLLDDGMTPVDIVKASKVDPRALRAILKERAQLAGGFFVTADDVDQLEKLLLELCRHPQFPIDDPAVLIAHLSTLTRVRCARCKKGTARACESCVHELIAKQEDRKRFFAQQNAERDRAEQSLQNVQRRRSGQQPQSPTPTSRSEGDEP